MNHSNPQMKPARSKEPPGRGVDPIGLWKGDCNEVDSTELTPSALSNQLLNRRTVKQRVIDHLMSGGALTQGDAWSRFGTSRLAPIVHTLRHEGYLIRAETVAVECADGRTAHVACYSMEVNHGTP